MPQPEDTPGPIDPETVKYLRLLVTVLSVTMIAGFIIIVALFVIRFSGSSGPALPNQITLPQGLSPKAFTRGDDWHAVVTADDQILIFDAETGRLRQTIRIEN